MSVIERFWAKVDKRGPLSDVDGSRCWIWTASTNQCGYGRFSLDGRHGKKVVAHRFSYELASGPIPEGLFLDHRVTCPRNCVNPSHLRLVTHKQNCENLSQSSSRNPSGLRGVSWNKRKMAWTAQVGHNGRLHHLGSFSTPTAAAAAAHAKRLELFTHNDADRR